MTSNAVIMMKRTNLDEYASRTSSDDNGNPQNIDAAASRDTASRQSGKRGRDATDSDERQHMNTKQATGSADRVPQVTTSIGLEQLRNHGGMNTQHDRSGRHPVVPQQPMEQAQIQQLLNLLLSQSQQSLPQQSEQQQLPPRQTLQSLSQFNLLPPPKRPVVQHVGSTPSMSNTTIEDPGQGRLQPLSGNIGQVNDLQVLARLLLGYLRQGQTLETETQPVQIDSRQRPPVHAQQQVQWLNQLLTARQALQLQQDQMSQHAQNLTQIFPSDLAGLQPSSVRNQPLLQRIHPLIPSNLSLLSPNAVSNNTGAINLLLAQLGQSQGINSFATASSAATSDNVPNHLLELLLQQRGQTPSFRSNQFRQDNTEQDAQNANLLESLLLSQLGGTISSSSTYAAATASSVPSLAGTGIRMALPADFNQLSEYQITVREQLEFFVSRQEDVESNIQGRKKQVRLGQVGMRCCHCAHLPLRQRGRGAVYYPTKLSGVYQAAQNMAATHLSLSCSIMPVEIRQKLRELHERRDTASGGKQYWAEACQVLGLFEDDTGIRFSSIDGSKKPPAC